MIVTLTLTKHGKSRNSSCLTASPPHRLKASTSRACRGNADVHPDRAAQTPKAMQNHQNSESSLECYESFENNENGIECGMIVNRLTVRTTQSCSKLDSLLDERQQALPRSRNPIPQFHMVPPAHRQFTAEPKKGSDTHREPSATSEQRVDVEVEAQQLRGPKFSQDPSGLFDLRSHNMACFGVAEDGYSSEGWARRRRRPTSFSGSISRAARHATSVRQD
jgi:hypothetical protein